MPQKIYTIYIYTFFFTFSQNLGNLLFDTFSKICPIHFFASILTSTNNWTGLSPHVNCCGLDWEWLLNVISWGNPAKNEILSQDTWRLQSLHPFFDEHSYQTVSYVIFTHRSLLMLMSLRLLSRVHLTPAGLLHGGRRGSQTWLWASAAGDGDGRLPAHHTQTVRRAKLIPEELQSCLVNGLFSGAVCKIQIFLDYFHKWANIIKAMRRDSRVDVISK